MALIEKYRFALLLLLIVLGALILLSYKINEPFVGGYQSYSTIYNIIAKNYLRYGYLTTKFGWVINSDFVSPGQFIYYTRHPPLFGIILSFGILFFGDHEWSIRFVPVLFSVGNIVLIFLIAKELWDRSIGIIASFFIAFSPINIVYGSHVDHIGSVVLFFMFATFFFYILWLKKQNNYCFFGMCLFLLLGLLTAWPAYFLVPFLLIHNLLTLRRPSSRALQGAVGLGRSVSTLSKPRALARGASNGLTKRSKMTLVLPLIAVLIFVLFIFYVRMLTGDWLGGQIKEMFLYRMGFSKIHPQWTEIGYPLPAGLGINFTFREFVVRMMYKMLMLFSPVLVFFSFIWLANIIKRREIRNEFLLIIFFFICGSYCFIFPNITFLHEYVLICLLGPIAIASALGFNAIKNHLPRILNLFILILLLAQTCVVTYEKHRRRIASELWEYTVGKTIREHVLAGEEIMTSGKLSFSAKYYADRFIRFEVRDLNNFLAMKNEPYRNYKYFIVKGDDPIEPELLSYLKANYPSFKEKDFLFFEIMNPSITPRLKSRGIYKGHTKRRLLSVPT